MDYEIYLRFGVNGIKFGHVKKLWGGYRLHSASKSKQSSDKQLEDANKIYLEYMKYFKKNCCFGANWMYYYYYLKRIIGKIINGSYNIQNIKTSRKIASNRKINK